jgi:hypothetical protein
MLRLRGRQMSMTFDLGAKCLLVTPCYSQTLTQVLPLS